MSKYAWHFITCLTVLYSSIYFQGFLLINIISVLLFLWTIKLIFTLIDFIFGLFEFNEDTNKIYQFIRELIGNKKYEQGIAQGGNINKTFLKNVIPELDKKMDLKVRNFEE